MARNNVVNSYGIICYRITPDEDRIEYLLVQRKHSISYIEFLRGKYSLKPENGLPYINYLLFTMTKQERENLLFHSFDELWRELWLFRNEPKIKVMKNGAGPSTEKHYNEYNNAKEKYEQIKAGKLFELTSGRKKLITLKELLNYPNQCIHTLEWGFPKGRKDRGEMPIKTAIREFVEETNYSEADIELFSDIPPFEEIFVGSNNQVYRYSYYLAKLKNSAACNPMGARINNKNYSQITEIGDIGWFPLEQANKKIGSLFLQRIGILEKLNRGIGKSKTFARLG